MKNKSKYLINNNRDNSYCISDYNNCFAYFSRCINCYANWGEWNTYSGKKSKE